MSRRRVLYHNGANQIEVKSMFDPNAALEFIRNLGEGEYLLGVIVDRSRFWRRVTVLQVVETDIAPCGHEGCPPLEVREIAHAVTLAGAQRKAREALRLQEITRQQIERSEALGG